MERPGARGQRQLSLIACSRFNPHALRWHTAVREACGGFKVCFCKPGCQLSSDRNVSWGSISALSLIPHACLVPAYDKNCMDGDTKTGCETFTRPRTKAGPIKHML